MTQKLNLLFPTPLVQTNIGTDFDIGKVGFRIRLIIRLMDQLFHSIQHTVEGCAYIVWLAGFFRWKYPKQWNKLLERISANVVSQQTIHKR